jgi:signal transduction histidine kinase
MSRVKLIQGELEIDSSPKRTGTTLIIRVPLEGVVKERQVQGKGLKNTQ